MIRYIINGFTRRTIPALCVFFIVMLATSIVEAIYQTPNGTTLNYAIIGIVLAFVLAFMYICVFLSFEYSVVGDVLVVRCFFLQKLKKSYSIYLRKPEVKFYTGAYRVTKEIFRRRRLCYLPLFGGVFKLAAICYNDAKGRRIKLIFKPSAPMVQAILDVREHPDYYPEQYTFEP